MMNRQTTFPKTITVAAAAILGLTVSLVIWPTSLAAQPRDIAAVERVVRSAEELAAAGRAEDGLKRVLGSLEASQSPKVQARLLFTAGWLHQQLAGETKGATKGDERKSHLGRAARRYQQLLALEGYAKHRQTSDNLATVLQQLGKPQDAIELLENSLQKTTQQRYDTQVRIGDLRVEMEAHDQALMHYLLAHGTLPDDDIAPWRVVLLLPRLAPSPRLYDFCRIFAEHGHQAVAVRGLETLFLDDRMMASVRDDALVLWIELQAESFSLDTSRLEELFKKQPTSVALRELLAFAQDPSKAVQDYKFWNSSNLRRHVLACALRDFGKTQQRNNAFEEAEAAYETGIERVSPDASAYQDESLRGKSMIRLNMTMDLLAMYYANKRLDPKEQKFQRYEQRLLGEKNVAYGARDVNAIREFHTVLGLIYAGRDKWKENSLRAAPYHLERAVSKSQESVKRSPEEYQPLPHLTKILAQGLEEHNGNKDEVRQLYVNAAKGFLDADDLQQADAVLKMAGKSAGKATAVEAPLKAVLAARQNVRSLDVSLLAPDRLDRNVNLEILKMQPSGAAGLSVEFLHRQRAKLYLEVGDKIQKSDDKSSPDSARRYQMKSLIELTDSPVVAVQDLTKVLERPAMATVDVQAIKNAMPKSSHGERTGAVIDKDDLKNLNLQIYRKPG